MTRNDSLVPIRGSSTVEKIVSEPCATCFFAHCRQKTFVQKGVAAYASSLPPEDETGLVASGDSRFGGTTP